MPQTCYMCDRVKTSDEHVPPKCIFPESKDLPAGKDLRKNLITVPSCEEHNLKKSGDDEHLLYVLVMCHPANDAGQEHFSSKVVRAIRRNASLANRVLANMTPATIEDAKGSFDTAAIGVDKLRLYSSLEKIGRGLYFHSLGEKWSGEILTLAHFIVHLDGPDSAIANQSTVAFCRASDQFFANIPPRGENPEVFTFRLGTQPSGVVMRLDFYEGAKVTLGFVRA